MVTTANDLRIDDLTVEYSKGGYTVRPVDHLTVSLEAGTLAVLLGPSGCGKTTLLSCLAAILKPTSGSITFGGAAVTGLTGAALTAHRRHVVGVIFQAFNLVPSLTSVENVAVPMRAAGIRARPARQRAVDLLQHVGLGERLDHKPGSLSGGQQQRVAIARAWRSTLRSCWPTSRPPTSTTSRSKACCASSAASPTADSVVLVSTHDERMLPLADRVIEMRPDSKPVEEAETITVALTAGEILFRQGAASDRIYVVDRGQVDIVRDSPDGELLLATLGPGEHLGEMGPIFSLPRSATARAGADATLTGYTPGAFRDLVGAEHLPALIRGR